MTQHSKNGKGVVCICDGQCPMTDDRHWINCPAHEYYANYLEWSARQSLAREPATADVGRVAGWTYEYDSGAGWETHTVLNTPPGLPTKRAPAKHYGSTDIRNVRPFYYAAPSSEPAIAEGERLRDWHDPRPDRNCAYCGHGWKGAHKYGCPRAHEDTPKAGPVND